MWASLLGAVSSASAQSGGEKIEPGRRDFTTGTSIVPMGTVQVEGGANFERGDDARQWQIGDLTVRIPLSTAFELRLLPLHYLIDHSPRRQAGFDDLGLQLRYRYYRSDAADLAVQVSAKLPSGARRVAERYAEPGVIFAATLKLAPQTKLALNLGASRASSDGVRFWQTFGAASLRVDVAERWNVIGEVYAFNRESSGGPSRHYAAIGAAYALDAVTALDARIGAGIDNGRGTDRLIGFGLTRRF